MTDDVVERLKKAIGKNDDMMITNDVAFLNKHLEVPYFQSKRNRVDDQDGIRFASIVALPMYCFSFADTRSIETQNHSTHHINDLVSIQDISAEESYILKNGKSKSCKVRGRVTIQEDRRIMDKGSMVTFTIRIIALTKGTTKLDIEIFVYYKKANDVLVDQFLSAYAEKIQDELVKEYIKSFDVLKDEEKDFQRIAEAQRIVSGYREMGSVEGPLSIDSKILSSIRILSRWIREFIF